jgi:cytochrome c biogenesis factor
MLFIKQIICLYILIKLVAHILIESWWAYHELGWGLWWFWDPVENEQPALIASCCLLLLVGR